LTSSGPLREVVVDGSGGGVEEALDRRHQWRQIVLDSRPDDRVGGVDLGWRCRTRTNKSIRRMRTARLDIER